MTSTLTDERWVDLHAALDAVLAHTGVDAGLLPLATPGGIDVVNSALSRTELRAHRTDLAEASGQVPRVPLVIDDGSDVTLYLPRLRGWDEIRWDAQHHRRTTRVAAPPDDGTAWSFHRRMPVEGVRGLRLLRFALAGRATLVTSTVTTTLLAAVLTFATPVGTLFLLAAILYDRHELIKWGVLALGGALLAGWLLATARDASVTRLQGYIQREVEPAVWDRLLSLPLSFFRAHPMRRLLSHAGGVSQLRTLFGATGLEAMLGAVFSAIAVALLTILDTTLGLAALGLLVVVATTVGVLSWLQQRHDQDVYDSVDDVQATVYPALLAVDEMHVYGGERAVFERWWSAFSTQKRADEAGLRWADASSALISATQPLMLAVLLPVAWIEGTGLTGLWAVALAATQLNLALSRLTGVVQGIFSVGPIHARLAPILDARPENSPAALTQGELGGRIDLDAVTFGYPDTAEPVLHGLDLHVSPGEFVAVVGPSGGGKSTLLRLVLGLDHPQQGTVRLDGRDLRSLDTDAVRAQIGYVPQDGRVLRGDVRSVILGAAADHADDAVAWAAAARAGLEDDLRALPMGLATRLSDGDAALSGGQLPRLLIARALAKNPTIVLLDEATSALDDATQEQVSDAVADLGLTRVVVAHRLSTIRRADRVVLVDHGVATELNERPTAAPPAPASPVPAPLPSERDPRRSASPTRKATAMSTVTRFKRFTVATSVPGDAVYLSSERMLQTRLQGALIQAMAPLLTGQRSRGEIVDALRDEYEPHRTERAIDRLIAAGHLVETDSQVDVRVGGFWEAAGVDGDRAVEALRRRTVDVVSLGDVRGARFEDAAHSVGLTVSGHGDLTVVVTDDYLHPALSEINQRNLTEKHPWLLVKPVGTSIWVGPVFEPGVTGCYECLRGRLASKSMLVSYLRQRQVIDDRLVTSLAELPGTIDIALRLGALQAAKWITGVYEQPGSPARPGTPGEVLTIDTVSLEQVHHPLSRRPQCRRCGDPGLQAEHMTRAIELTGHAKIESDDGGHRASKPEDFVERYSHLVSPITGPISNLAKVPLDVEGLHTYTAGQNFAVPMSNINDLRAGLRSASAGKGMSDIQARASALGEAIERYSGVYHGDEPTRVASFHELGADAIEPNDLHHYSAQQFRDRAEWNARPSHFHWVADQLDPDLPVEWSPVWSLTEKRHKWFPTSGLYFSYSNREHPFQAGANSNGCAAGTTLEDAILQGFMELVERDSVAMWWYHRLRMPRIDLDSFDEPYFRTWQERYASLNRRTWVLDVTNDLGIPSVVAVSYRTDKPVQDMMFALGAHFDVKVAIGRALSEMNQFLPAVIGKRSDGSGEYAYNDPVQLDWWQHETIERQPYLLPSDEVRTAADYHDRSTDDLADDVRLAQSVVERHGMEMLVLDQTRIDVGLPVARVMVPGMRHFWPRYAPGRLYDIPLELGWIDAARTEDDLNPIAMFL